MLPAWQCPVCNRGTLSIEKETKVTKETAISMNARLYNPSWEPEWMEKRVILFLICKSCKEPVALIGREGIVDNYDNRGDWHYTEIITPIAIEPAVIPIEIPENCPEAIENSIRDASSLYWSNPPAAGNALRTAVESLMSHLKIQKSKLNKKRKKRDRLSLHKRIELFRDKNVKNKKLGDALLAIKWLGNAGSHSTKLTMSDVLDAFELLEHVLEELIHNRTNKLGKLAKEIIKSRGPVRTKPPF